MAQAPPLRTAADFRPVPAGVRGSEADYALAHPHAELEKGDPQQLVVEDGMIMLLGRTVSSRARTVKACSTQQWPRSTRPSSTQPLHERSSNQ